MNLRRSSQYSSSFGCLKDSSQERSKSIENESQLSMPNVSTLGVAASRPESRQGRLNLKVSQSSQPKYAQTGPTPLSVMFFSKRCCSDRNALLEFLPSRKRFASTPAQGKRLDRAVDTPR